MKRFFPMLCAMILLGIFPAAARQKGPVIEFDVIAKELGRTVYDGEVIKEVFRFTNKGDAVLEIKNVEVSCGCTSAVPNPDKLAPGMSGELTVAVTTEATTAPTGKRTEISKAVTVTSNDPVHPVVTLTISGAVDPEVALSEPSVWFGGNPQGRPVTKEVIAEIAAGRDIRILGVASTDPHVSVSLQPFPAGSDKKFKIILTQKAEAPAGMHSGEIVLKTTSRIKPEVKFTVRGLIAKGN